MSSKLLAHSCTKLMSDLLWELFLKFCLWLNTWTSTSVFGWNDSKTAGPVSMFSLSTVSPKYISNGVHIFTFTSEIQVCCWLNVRFLLIELWRHRITLKWLTEIISGGSSISQLQCTFAMRTPCQVFLFFRLLLTCLLHTATCGPLRAALPAHVIDRAGCCGLSEAHWKTAQEKKHFATCSK